jgi:hypothetical protein
MNILEIEDIIKGLPDQSLIQEAQAPSGQMPQFLVVSEIQRRADMRKRFQNQQQEMPQGTIADQIVQSGIASMGNRQPIQSMPPQGMPSQGMPPMPQQGMPQGMPQQGMPMQQQPPMMPPMSPPMPPPMSPPMMPPAQGMAAGGVVRMQAGTQTPYTGGTEAYQNLIDQALMAGGTSRDIQALIGGNPEAQAVYNSMRGPNPQTASIPYGEEFDGRKAVVGGSPGYTPYYLSNSDEDRRKALLENIEYNQKQQEIISGRNPEADYIPAYLSNFASMPNTQGATSDSIRSQNKRQQDKLDQRRNQTDEESILNLERFSRMMDMNSPNYSLVGSGFGFDLGETIDPVQRRIDSQSRLADRDPQAKEILAQREKRRQENYESSPFGGQLFVDNRPRDIRLGSNFTPATDFSGFDPVVDEFLSPYLNPNFDVSSDAAGGNAQKADTKRFGEGTRTANPETTAEAIETGMNTGSSEKTVQKDLSKDSDYSSLTSSA